MCCCATLLPLEEGAGIKHISQVEYHLNRETFETPLFAFTLSPWRYRQAGLGEVSRDKPRALGSKPAVLQHASPGELSWGIRASFSLELHKLGTGLSQMVTWRQSVAKADFLLMVTGKGSMHRELLSSNKSWPLLILTSFSTDKQRQKDIIIWILHAAHPFLVLRRGRGWALPASLQISEDRKFPNNVFSTCTQEAHTRAWRTSFPPRPQSLLCYFKQIILEKKTREAEETLSSCND